MRFANYLLLFLISISILSCSKKELKETVVKEKNLNLQVLEAYKDKDGDTKYRFAPDIITL